MRAFIYSLSFALIAYSSVRCTGPEYCDGDCPENPHATPVSYALHLPDHFPTPLIPADNPLTEQKVALGKLLFYERALSRDSTISCASCHRPQQSFSDPQALSRGVENRIGTKAQEKRNSMALFNLMWHPNLFWDGRVRNSAFDVFDALEQQALQPIVAFHEMDNTIEEALARLKADQDYPRLFEKVFDDTITADYLAQALASFERTLVSFNSKYDLFVTSGYDTSVFTPLEKQGLLLFFSEGSSDDPHCSHCHFGINFDHPNGEFFNNGLEISNDAGLYMQEPKFENFGKFKVPSLRNLSFTAPYMHDGRFSTLDEVLEHYDGDGSLYNTQDPIIKSIGIKPESRKALLAFLQTLDDTIFINNPAFLP